MFYGEIIVDSEAHVFNHLACVKFDAEDTFLTFGSLSDCLSGEGPESDGADDADLDSFFCSEFFRFGADTGDRTESNDQIICAFNVDFFPTCFVLFDFTIASLELMIDNFPAS